MDFYNQLVENTEWQELELQDSKGFGSFTRVKIKLEQPYLFINGRGNVYLHQNDKLATANGYWCLDGREFVMLSKEGRHFTPIATIHVEDCGLGTQKAITCCAYFGYRFKGFHSGPIK